MIKVSVQDAVTTMKREFADLTSKEFSTGVSRAINHTIAKTKTAASREMRTVYNMSAKDVGKALTLRKSNRFELYGMVVASGRPLPLKMFSPRKTKRGISVMIKKGSRVDVNGAFMATMSSGHSGVFARGRQSGPEFYFRHKRTIPAGGYVKINGKWRPKNNDLQIGEVTTLSIPKAFSNEIVLRALDRQISEDFPNRIMHELQRLR